MTMDPEGRATAALGAVLGAVVLWGLGVVAGGAMQAPEDPSFDALPGPAPFFFGVLGTWLGAVVGVVAALRVRGLPGARRTGRALAFLIPVAFVAFWLLAGLFGDDGLLFGYIVLMIAWFTRPIGLVAWFGAVGVLALLARRRAVTAAGGPADTAPSDT